MKNQGERFMTVENMVAAPLPNSVCRLSAPEQLLIWAFRRRVFGGEHWQLASAELRRHLPSESAERLLEALDRFVVTACLRARRTLTFHRLDCHCLGADELSLLAIVAAAQWHETSLARATSRWLVRADAVDWLAEDGQVVADVLAAQGWSLPIRQMRAPAADHGIIRQPLKQVPLH